MSRSMDSSLLTSVLQLMYGVSFSMTLHTRATNMSIFLCQTFQVTMWMLASLQWALRGGDFQLFHAYLFTVGELPSLKRSQRVQTPENQWLENYIFRELLGLGREYLVTFCRQNSSICLGKKIAQISVNWTLVIVDDWYGWCFPLVCRRWNRLEKHGRRWQENVLMTKSVKLRRGEDKNPDCLVNAGAHTAQLYWDHFKNHYTDPILNPSHCSNTSERGATDLRRRYSQYHHLLPEYVGHLRKIVMLQPYWWHTSNWQSVSIRWNKVLQSYVTGNVAKVANQLFHFLVIHTSPTFLLTFKIEVFLQVKMAPTQTTKIWCPTKFPSCWKWISSSKNIIFVFF